MAKRKSDNGAEKPARIFVVSNLAEGTTQYLSAKTKAEVFKYLLGDYDVRAAKRGDLLAIVNGDAELETIE